LTSKTIEKDGNRLYIQLCKTPPALETAVFQFAGNFLSCKLVKVEGGFRTRLWWTHRQTKVRRIRIKDLVICKD
jgi:hypothetical protein